jgi:hypothetical protein
MKCRHCGTPLAHTFLDLGFAPPSNSYLNEVDLSKPEKYYPLKIKVCDHCWLAQTEQVTDANELFTADYAYFSSTSSGWLLHAKRYAIDITQQLQLDRESFVIEVASNDGYLLKNFLPLGIPCLGIEPTDSTARAAEQLGIPVLREFFGESLGKRLADGQQQADLIVGNNVYAHVPDINDFTRGLKAALKPSGTITLEFPHLMALLEHSQFDTVYHEHFSYLSLFTAQRIFASAGLRIWDVVQLPTHGGSLRIYGCHMEDPRASNPSVNQLLDQERQRGLQLRETYFNFQATANRVKDDFLDFLIAQKRAGKTVAAYGAAAKGNTLLNYAGIKPDLLPLVCDAAASKQGMYMPGSHIPIYPPARLASPVPDFVVVLPWNIANEVMEQLALLRAAGTRFVTAIPRLRIQ